MTDQNSVTLITLGDQGNTIADPTQDIRGRTVIDADGTKIGRIADLLVDLEEQKVRFLRVEDGGNGNSSDWGLWLDPTLSR